MPPLADVNPVRPVALTPPTGDTEPYALGGDVKNTFGTKVKPVIRPVLRLLHPLHEDVDVGHPYLAN